MTIRVGKDRNWSSVLARALKQISHGLVLVLMEDYFLDKPVDTPRIVRLAEYMKSKRAVCLRLLPSPGPDILCDHNPEVGELRKGAPYRLSLQAAIWDKNALLGLLRWGETAWELEVLGSRRTDDLEAPFLSVPRDHPALTYRNAVIKGRWDPEVVEFCRKENVALELPIRPTDSGQPPPSMNLSSRYMRALRRRVRFRQRSLSLRRHWHRL